MRRTESQGRVAGKVAIVAGAASGMGAGHAKTPVTEGARAVALDLGPTASE